MKDNEAEREEREEDVVVLQTLLDVLKLLGNDENAQNEIVNENRLTLHRQEGE